jgi:hypothetical protein
VAEATGRQRGQVLDRPAALCMQRGGEQAERVVAVAVVVVGRRGRSRRRGRRQADKRGQVLDHPADLCMQRGGEQAERVVVDRSRVERRRQPESERGQVLDRSPSGPAARNAGRGDLSPEETS